MITVYANGQQFLERNRALLGTNPYLAVFFNWDAPLLEKTGRINYAVKCTSGENELLAMKAEPYDLLLFGSPACCGELLKYLINGGYEIKNYLCDTAVGSELARLLESRYGRPYEEALAMEFMEADSCAEQISPEVETPSEADLDELVECLQRFTGDCGLQDQVSRERTARGLAKFRVLRRNGRIISMAAFTEATDRDMKITNVYTRDEYRGRGFARKVVGSVTAEILAAGKIATLNVDRRNPVTNHLYRALGFRPLFTQGEYRPVPEE